MYRTSGEIWTCCCLRYASGETDRQANRQTDRSTSHPYRGRSKTLESSLSAAAMAVFCFIILLLAGLMGQYGFACWRLSPVGVCKAPSTPATMSPKTATLSTKQATMSPKSATLCFWQQCCRIVAGFGDIVAGFGDNVAVFGDNVAVFGDIVAGVDGT